MKGFDSMLTRTLVATRIRLVRITTELSNQIRGIMKTSVSSFGRKGSTFEDNVQRLLFDQDGLASVVLPTLEAWHSICIRAIRAAELGRQLVQRRARARPAVSSCRFRVSERSPQPPSPQLLRTGTTSGSPIRWRAGCALPGGSRSGLEALLTARCRLRSRRRASHSPCSRALASGRVSSSWKALAMPERQSSRRCRVFLMKVAGATKIGVLTDGGSFGGVPGRLVGFDEGGDAFPVQVADLEPGLRQLPPAPCRSPGRA
ncbi:hypothetical protein EV128_13735 [Rhizobium azibense]|nr:hypothetical protein EV128_13735 [Rhizobium azibense]